MYSESIETKRRNIKNMVLRLRKEDIKNLSESELNRCLSNDEKLVKYAQECISVGLLDMIRLFPDRFLKKEPKKKKERPVKKSKKSKKRKTKR